MYLGRIVELATATALRAPAHALHGRADVLGPVPDPPLAGAGRRHSAATCPRRPTRRGCEFRTRCWKAQDVCSIDTPLLEPKDGGNLAACHFPLTDEEVLERVPSARTCAIALPRRPTAALDAERLEVRCAKPPGHSTPTAAARPVSASVSPRPLGAS